MLPEQFSAESVERTSYFNGPPGIIPAVMIS
jgi:hypothetical protein